MCNRRRRVDLIEPSVVGTRNVLNACLKAKAKRVVVVSSIGAVIVNPNWPKDQAMDEECWSDRDSCKTTKNYYCLGKTIAESEAFEYAKRGELDIVTVCPSIVIGTMLQPTINSSSLLLLTMLKENFVDSMHVYHDSFTEVDDCEKLSSEKLQDLGWKYRPLEESIVDSVMNYEERGLLLKK
ncbi:hypothetical protein Dsin_003973 [Dipteronia sinensis]|uniref:Thioester reductase (TE) domain-containing protein n=1 Tax=Dipteronia sinensis TaxID=43782 RepID=A0AAE0BA61_9ROSI|nr:hypothetical protein Dsin_003973 [Dipteronia sinensis]